MWNSNQFILIVWVAIINLIILLLRPWANKLRRRLTARVRKRAKKNSVKDAMVRRYKDRKGRPRVFCPYSLWEICASDCNLLNSVFFLLASLSTSTSPQLRCGSKALKRSQVYPKGYGKAIVKYHTKWAAS